MPAVEVSEKDFEAVVSAALEAQSIGDMNEARALDKLARKISTALSREHGGVTSHKPSKARTMDFPGRTFSAS